MHTTSVDNKHPEGFLGAIYSKIWFKDPNQDCHQRQVLTSYIGVAATYIWVDYLFISDDLTSKQLQNKFFAFGICNIGMVAVAYKYKKEYTDFSFKVATAMFGTLGLIDLNAALIYKSKA